MKEKEKEGCDRIVKSERGFIENDFSSEGIKLLREREMNVASVIRE